MRRDSTMMNLLQRAAAAALLAGLAWVANVAPAAEEAKLPKEGQPAPDIDLPATQITKALPDAKDAKTLPLKSLQGKKNVVLFFFPKAMTPGCTVESCGFRDKVDELAKLDTVVIGISTDTIEDQKKFTDKENLNFPLYADTE